jgi:hypothetical protein
MIEALEMRLRDAGIACRLEARDRLLIVISADGAGAPLTREHRGRVLDLARGDGFTHVAVELDPRGAPLSRD